MSKNLQTEQKFLRDLHSVQQNIILELHEQHSKQIFDIKTKLELLKIGQQQAMRKPQGYVPKVMDVEDDVADECENHEYERQL